MDQSFENIKKLQILKKPSQSASCTTSSFDHNLIFAGKEFVLRNKTDPIMTLHWHNSNYIKNEVNKSQTLNKNFNNIPDIKNSKLNFNLRYTKIRMIDIGIVKHIANIQHTSIVQDIY